MQLAQFLSLILGFIMLTSATPARPVRIPVRSKQISRRHTGIKHALSEVANAQALDIKDFLISNISSSIDPAKETWDLEANFIFTDLNSNTSTSCSQAWPQTNGTNAGAPLDYVQCDAVNNGTEFFIWKITSYTSPKSFSIELAHEFSDPVHYPPPYNYVEYFAPLTVSLPCEDAAGLECALPGPLHAAVDAISN